MSIASSHNGQVATFALQGLPQHVFQDEIYTDAQEALGTGAPIVSELLGFDEIEQVGIIVHNGVQHMQITLAQPHRWDSETFFDDVAAFLTEELYTSKKPLIAPSHQAYYKPTFLDQVNRDLAQAAEEEALSTLSHGGSVRADSFQASQGKLKLVFGGVCATTQCPATPIATGRLAMNYLSERHPGAFNRKKTEHRFDTV